MRPHRSGSGGGPALRARAGLDAGRRSTCGSVRGRDGRANARPPGGADGADRALRSRRTGRSGRAVRSGRARGTGRGRTGRGRTGRGCCPDDVAAAAGTGRERSERPVRAGAACRDRAPRGAACCTFGFEARRPVEVRGRAVGPREAAARCAPAPRAWRPRVAPPFAAAPVEHERPRRADVRRHGGHRRRAQRTDRRRLARAGAAARPAGAARRRDRRSALGVHGFRAASSGGADLEFRAGDPAAGPKAPARTGPQVVARVRLVAGLPRLSRERLSVRRPLVRLGRAPAKR